MDSSSSKLVQRLAEQTLALCRIPSPIGQEKAIADYIQHWALRHFSKEQVVRHGHSLVLGALSDSRPSIALFGHVDTVPAHVNDRPPQIEENRLRGLGSSDMKGGLAVMMALAEDLPRDRLPVNLLLVLYEREEGPYLENGLGPLFEAVPDLKKVQFGIALEPTDGVVQVGCAGSLHATVRFTGKSAHSARPWQGENAIHRAGAFLAKLHALPRLEVIHAGFPFYEVFSVTKATGGRARNVVPDLFELNLNYRFAPGKSIEEAQSELRQFVGGHAEIVFTDLSPSGRVCAENPFFKSLLALTQLPASSKQAWTDVARLATMGVDAVNFGPGETSQAHQENESAPLDALAFAYEKLSLFLQQAGNSTTFA